MEEIKEKYDAKAGIVPINNVKSVWSLNVGSTLLNRVMDKGRQFGVGLKSKVKQFSDHYDASKKFYRR